MEAVSMHTSRNKGQYDYFPHGQRALSRENHNKNALVVIIQKQKLTTCITFACLYIQLFKHYRIAAATFLYIGQTAVFVSCLSLSADYLIY